MNELMHEVINKFNNINIACGALALEFESDEALVNDSGSLKARTKELLNNVEEDLKHCRKLLIEITRITAEKLSCYQENEDRFKELEPILSTVEEKAIILKNIVGRDRKPLLTELIKLLHEIEEKALGCAIILKDLRSALIKSGKYKPEGT